MSLSVGEYIATSPDILEKIQRLLSGVAPKEAINILQIIKRLKDIYQNTIHSIQVLEQSEIDALRAIHTDFYDKILKINDEAFVYAGYFLPINHFEAGVFYYKHSLDIFESSTLDSIRHRDFIDVGGFIGDSAIIFEKEFCDKKIYTFEATSVNYNLMLKTLKLNDSKRIVPINKGLGAKSSEIEISIAGSGSTMSDATKSLWDSDTFQKVERVEIITLDSYVEQHNIDVGFIKVDIEGFEQEFLKGAKETIKRFKPAMLISIYHNASDFFDIKPLIESWNLGYTFKFHKPVDGNISIETALYCEVL
ncbi:FkbM family methyltransferase [Helicobacter saguini]|uniref:FkbM family methyltransferase n=2 Tax=Helicobacter saguini TaxID=1548018 RepID=A0A347VTU1_9HELI|nr:FkbM family methyltransferase [Helicobacter saguini]MWV67733.1 FkbM family methyltransferase [Helicobacter saguini]MWV70798.1 FkbM family methyltransferase [Helicobacter saguini]MWV72702.1 FkbM family methyltransferase [Helicobacter saguini]TLD94607.1 FkbM family methyltransferase [Helicobacter saguini]